MLLIQYLKKRPKTFACAATLCLALIVSAVTLFFPPKKYHARIPVKFLPTSGLPYVEAKIGGGTFNLMVDLGSAFAAGLTKEVIHSVNDIEKLPNRTVMGIKGIVEESECYRIPLIQIENYKLSRVPVLEEDLATEAQRTLIQARGPNQAAPQDTDSAIEKSKMLSGHLGLPAFTGGGLLIDLPHGVLYSTKNLEVLQRKEHISIEGYVKAPFTLHRGQAIVSLKTDIGKDNFLLDTGCTKTIFREALVEPVDPESVGPDQWKSFCASEDFIIGGVNFGPQFMLLYDFAKQSTAFDGILGLDFFKKHAIYFDFQEQCVYIQPPPSEPEPTFDRNSPADTLRWMKSQLHAR